MADNTDWKARAEAAESAVGVLLDLIRRMPQTLVAQPGEASSEMAQTLADLGRAAAARDARLREEGRREGIEESAKRHDEWAREMEVWADAHPQIADSDPQGWEIHQQEQQWHRDNAGGLRALLDKPAGEDGR